MLLAVPYFGDDPRFRKLLDIWWKYYEASGTTVPATLISDLETTPPMEYPCVRVDTWEARQAMRGHVFDRKGAIVICAAQVLGNFLACDMDAFVLRDPLRYLQQLQSVPFATVADQWRRPILLRFHDYVEIAQRQAGVLWFGPCDREKLLADYVQMFGRLKQDFESDNLLEQFAWSGIWHTMGRHDMPKELNWQYCKDGEEGRERAAIFHEHGAEKLKRLQ